MNSAQLVVIKCLLVTRSKKGATIREIKDDYFKSEGSVLAIDDSSLAANLMGTEGVTRKIIHNEYYYFFKSTNSEHITKMIERQRDNSKKSKKTSLSQIKTVNAQNSVITTKSKQTNSIINGLKNEGDTAAKSRSRKTKKRSSDSNKNGELEKLLKSRDDKIRKLEKDFSTLSMRTMEFSTKSEAHQKCLDKKILTLEAKIDRLCEILHKSTPNPRDDTQQKMTNSLENNATIFRECIEKLTEKIENISIESEARQKDLNEKILTLQASNNSTPYLHDIHPLMTMFTNYQESSATILRQCIEKLTEKKVDSHHDVVLQMMKQHKSFQTTIDRQMCEQTALLTDLIKKA